MRLCFPALSGLNSGNTKPEVLLLQIDAGRRPFPHSGRSAFFRFGSGNTRVIEVRGGFPARVPTPGFELPHWRPSTPGFPSQTE
jgi:hypothetical protein